MKSFQILAFALLAASSHAGTPALSSPAPAATDSGWWFRAAPYGWLTAIDGTIGIGSLSAPVDVSLSDTLDNVDMAFMGVFEAGVGRWSLGVDVVYGKVSEDVDAGGRIFDSFRFEEKQWLITPFVAYRLIDTGRYHMDIFAGARVTAIEAELTGRYVGEGQITRSRDTAWVDPIIGIRGQAELSDRVFFRYNGDVGGFGVSSDFTWQAFAGFGYHCTDMISIALGYRGIGVDYSKDSLSLDTVTHGPVLGVEIRW